jgi:hypothetical protein
MQITSARTRSFARVGAIFKILWFTGWRAIFADLTSEGPTKSKINFEVVGGSILKAGMGMDCLAAHTAGTTLERRGEVY